MVTVTNRLGELNWPYNRRTFMKKIGTKFLLAVILNVFSGTYLIHQKKFQYLLLTSSIPVNGKN